MNADSLTQQTQDKVEKFIDLEKVRDLLNGYGYELIQQIGKGGHGICCRVKNVKYQQTFVCKISKNDPRSLEEFRILSQLHHQNIVSCYDLFTINEYTLLILEDCPGNNLHDEIQLKGRLDSKKLSSYVHQLLEAVNFLHNKKIAHLDIKPSNILLDKHGRIKLIDFGLSKKFNIDEKCYSFQGTQLFKGPEYMTRKPFDPFKADLWALGLTIHYLSTGSLLSYTNEKLYAYVSSGYFMTPISGMPSVIRQICSMCLNEKPSLRKDINEILHFFREKTFYDKNQADVPNFYRSRSAMKMIITPTFIRVGDKKRIKTSSPSILNPQSFV